MWVRLMHHKLLRPKSCHSIETQRHTQPRTGEDTCATGLFMIWRKQQFMGGSRLIFR